MMEVEFEVLWRELGAVGSSLPVYQSLEAAYSAPARVYHTLEHVRWGLRRIDEIGAREEHEPHQLNPIRWAMWFHDVVMTFDDSRDDDEERSARSAHQHARAAGLPPAFCDRVMRLVLSTSHLAEKLAWDEAILVDADLSILGAGQGDFDVYEDRIRREWSLVGDRSFAQGRIAILNRFLMKRRIFTTNYARDKWEARAQVNLRRSVEKLKALL